MLYFEIVLGAKILEDFKMLHLPALAVNERHIWWICYDMYVWQINVCKRVLEELASALDLASSRLCNATGEDSINGIEHVSKFGYKQYLNASFGIGER